MANTVKIAESETNRFLRTCMTLALSVLIIITSFTLVLDLLFFDTLMSLPTILLLPIGWYTKKRIAKVEEIGKNYIVFAVGKNRRVIEKNNIISIRKWARFTVSERIWMSITYKHGKKKERYLFQTEPKMDMLKYFTQMGIILNNLP
jgi:hypothetical protein